MDRDAAPMEDAAVVRPDSGPRLVFTVDFITPIVDEPETFGAVAAANSISDVYAMGGEPQVALAICGFPGESVPTDIVRRIFQGGRDKAAEAGCAVAGGHTVLDPELKYGLCVLGTVDPDRMLSQTGGRVGDRLVLTKPIGFGIAAQALKRQRLAAGEIEQLVAALTALNQGAKDAALAAGARAATDVTGFGLLGHLHHLALGSRTAARLFAAAVPALDFVRKLAGEGLVPGGSENNLRYARGWARFDDALSDTERLLLSDAQTSGGLLIAVPPEREARLREELARRGTLARAVVGELTDGPAGRVEVVRSRG